MTALAARRGGRAERAVGLLGRVLRTVADPRLALALLLLAAGANVVAAAVPDGGALLDAPPYLALLGALVASGMAGVAVRAPATWREWRHPPPLPPGPEMVVAELGPERAAPAELARLADGLRAAGYRVVERGSGTRWSASGIRHGWVRLASLGSHLAVVLLVLGAAIGTAFSSETTFSLLPGDQAALDEPRAGFTDAVRLDAFAATFGPDGRPRSFDTTVTFLRDGEAVSEQLLHVNEPGSFGGYLVHAWEYGPAAELGVTTLGGRVLADAALPLDEAVDGRPGRLLELPTMGLTLGIVLVDPAANELAVGVAGGGGLVDAVRLAPGEARRVGGVEVRHGGMTSFVTFLSRRDPGQAVLFAGAGLLVATLVAGFWVPWRRATLSAAPAGLRLAVRTARPESAAAELERLRGMLSAQLPGAST